MMVTIPSEISLQNPRGYQVESELLQEFERGLDPLDPQASRVPCHVLGYGEISTVFEIQVEDLRDLAFKRMSCFETLDEVKPYVDTYMAYNQTLENQVGLHLPPYGYALLISESGRPVFYIIQQRLRPSSIGNKAIQLLSPLEVIALFQQVLLELHKVWSFNRTHQDRQLGIDGQISNWAIEGFDPQHPSLSSDATLLYLDTSTPILRLNGVEQLNAELFLRSAPPYLAWILRMLFLQEVVTRYYDARKVTIDLIANFYKEQRPELIPELVAAANAYIKGEGADLGLIEITEKEVSDYYREDELIWRLYLGMRRFDRFVRKKMLHLDYPYILPGKIKR
jgi:Family of unknown function (DUF6206)